MKYTKELLEDILKEGDASVLGDYKKYNQRMRVSFTCSCGVETSKRFEILNLYRLPYCEECSKVKIIEKGKATCMEKYGVDNAGKDPEIILRIKHIFTEKYGIHPKKTQEVQDKWKATCLKVYGGHPNQNKEVQAKSEASLTNLGII
jgi:hypothetical protein